VIWIPVVITFAAFVFAWHYTPEDGGGENAFGWVFGCLYWLAAAVVSLIIWLVWALEWQQ
jgi:hypothetical protein